MIAKSAQIASTHARNALKFLSQEVQGLQAAAYVLAVCALLSSLLALVRDRLLAHSFGASTTLDIYYAGFRLPDIIFVATAALVSVYMLIPELSRRTESEQKDYIDTIVVGFSLFAIVVAGLAALFAPYLLALLFPQFVVQGYLDELTQITRIMLLQPLLLGLSNILAAITQARYRYTLYSLSPLLYNLGIIVGITVLYPAYGLPGLAWGVVGGAFMHMVIQLPSIIGDGFFRRVPLLRDMKGLVRTAQVSIPRALALSMNQITFLGLTVLAAMLGTGSIAIFMFASNLQAVPLAIIGASYSVAAFPTLAKALSAGEQNEFITHVATAARYVFFWSLPVSALILVLRAHIVRVILGSGEFNWNDTRLTAAAFALLSFALVAQGVTLLLVRGYYAAGRTFVPFVVSVGVALTTLVLGTLGVFALKSAVFLDVIERLMRVEDLPGSNVLALAFAFAFASIAGALVLAFLFERRFRGFFSQLRNTLMESCIAAFAAGLGAHIFLELVSSFYVSSTTLSIFVQGGTAGLFGMLMAGLAYMLSGNQEFRETYISLHARLWRVRPKEEVTLVASAEE